MPRKEWYDKNKENAKEYQREYMKTRADRQAVNEYHRNYYHTKVKPRKELLNPVVRSPPAPKATLLISRGEYILSFD